MNKEELNNLSNSIDATNSEEENDIIRDKYRKEITLYKIEEAFQKNDVGLQLDLGIKEMPIGIKKLSYLKYLNLMNARIQNFDFFEYLPNLESLNLSDNELLDISFLKYLPKLTSLYLGNNKITDISHLKYLPNLTGLDLSKNKIEDISVLSKMPKLESIGLFGNQITHFPIKILHLEHLRYISLYDNPIKNIPIVIIEQGIDAIRRYFKELENKETITNNQTKLIFVGNSRAGKTSLWQFLKDKIYNEQADSTHGIKTEIWDTETLGTEDNQNLAAHIWDFGGQEYYHATHRIFLCENTVYVLVWEKGSNKQGTRLEKFKLDDDPNGEIEEVELEHFPASYWLENIQYFASKHCPVLIVQNKVDEEVLKANYTEGVQEVNDCFHLSVQNAFGFQEGNLALKRHDLKFQDFKERLLELLRKNATAFKLVKYYAQVREALEVLAKEKEYITVSELKEIALGFDETPDEQNLLAYLKSFTNTVLYFQENPKLNDRLYLNPTHISRDIYKILNKQVRENNGKFDVTHIQTRLNCDLSEAERFVALMKEFDLVFEKSKTIKGETKRQFITPQYLPKKEDLSEDIQFLIEGYSLETAFTIQFKAFVPRSLMLRFIAENGALSNQETYWRNGIIYKSPTTQSMIKVEYDHDQSTFTIQVQNKQKQTIDMQNIVEQFVKLENSDEHIKISNDGKLYVDLRTIRKLQHENRREDICNEKGELIPLSKFDWLTQKQKVKMKKHLLNLMTAGKLGEALELMRQIESTQNSYFNNDLIGYLSRYNRNEKEKNQSIISLENYRMEYNQIENATKSLLDSEFDESKAPAPPSINTKENVQPVPVNNKKILPLKILMLTANPANTTKLNLDKEHSMITIKLQNKQDKFNLILRKAVSATEFKEFTETELPAILHFSGHGEGGKEGGIFVQNDDKNEEFLIPTAGLDALFEYFKDQNMALDAVILNACYSEDQALTIASHVGYVVGTSVELGDALAIAFSTGFYFKLAESNFDFELAFKSGRTQAAMNGASKSHFVLYKNGQKLVI